MLLKIRSFFLRLKDIRIAQRIWIFLLIFIDYNYLISNVVRVYGSIVIINRYCFIYFYINMSAPSMSGYTERNALGKIKVFDLNLLTVLKWYTPIRA